MPNKKLALVAIALSLTLTITTQTTAAKIRWRSGDTSTNLTDPTTAARSIASICQNQSKGTPVHMVVQFDGPITNSDREELHAGGIEILSYLGDNSFFAAASPDSLDAKQLESVTALRAANPIQRDWKLHPELADNEVVPWSVVKPLPDDKTPDTITAEDNPHVAAYVLFHADVDTNTEGAAILRQHNASIRSALRSINGFVIELPYNQIKILADNDAVQYIEPPLPGFSELNNSNRLLTGADVAQDPPYNLDGSGVTALVYDGGTVLSTHPDLVGRVRIGDSDGLSDHSTHVAGTIAGDGTASTGLYRGMAPGVFIDSYGFETGGPLEAGFLYTDPGDLENNYNDSINNFGADIANNSIGTNVARNGFPCSWQGDYGATSALIDAIVRGSLGAPFRIVWANGNERGDGSCGTMYHTTAPPACAKNHIAVGALNSNNDTVSYFTSWGPTDDGRLKPDISAPGCQLDDDDGVTSCSSSGGYAAKCGTSMASPTVCGLSALLLQDFRIQYPGEPDFRNSTLKALLAHTAVDLENPGPDYRSGYGSVRIVPAIDHMRSGNFLEDQVEQGEVVQVLVIVSPGDTELKVTLAWDDAPGTPNVDPALVNDLDLRVFDPTLVQYYPWTLDPANPQNDAVRTQADHVNNIEQVVIDAPSPGAYLVEIVAYNVPEGPQPFSLVASPLLINCSTMGDVVLGRAKYACTSTATITVNDCDLNTNGEAIESITIPVVSTSDPSGRLVTLTETGPETALFIGTININTNGAGDGLLVAEGDIITATYIDADDGFGGTNVTVTTTATVDCTPPTVSDIAVTELDPRSATIEFDTNELAVATVHYGIDCADLNEIAASAALKTEHAIDVKPINDDTTYFYAIEVSDQAGNTTIDDNSGACFSFTTPEIPDYFTQQFNGDLDLATRTTLFAPNGSVDFYGACSYETLVLPTDPAGGTSLYMTDTASATVQLTNGHEVLLYGSSYNTLYINANGNITFNSADSDTTETFDEHFESPRIAALYDDLDPSEGGGVSWKELQDRVVVTWYEVPEDNGNNDNTFQIEMFYDGRIQMTWLGIDANDAIVGLSAGLGTPIDFIPSDLSEFEDCGPRAPSAAGRTVVLGQDRQVTIALLASDDEKPDPPGALTYIITELPEFTLQDAGTEQVIGQWDLPYTLANGGNEVIYTPAPGYVGPDAFDFKANDGGSPPDAGDSNTATVIIDVDPVLTVPFFDEFPTTIFDDDKWAITTTTSIDDVGIDEPSPPYSARVNGFTTGGDTLITHIIDTSAIQPGELKLVYSWERTGNGESPDSGDNFFVEYVDTNGFWQLLRQFAGDGNDMTSYVQDEVLLPAEAMHDNFRIRFRSKGTASSSSNMDDWFVDNIILGYADAPLAYGTSVRVHENESMDITLAAIDPNSDPLDFIILSLPEHGTLLDPNASAITALDLPYTLSNGNLVQYEPQTDYKGSDQFRFKVSDGTYFSNEAGIALFVEPLLTLPFEDEFPDLDFDVLKWSNTEGATIDNLGIDEPSAPFSARFNGNPNRGDILESYDIDLEGKTGIRLQYYWQRTGEGETPDTGDDLTLEYVDTNGTWQVLAVHLGGEGDMTAYELADILLPDDALHGSFRIRFSNTATTGNVDDWFVDDIRVYSQDAPNAYDQHVAVPKFGTATIELQASDPNGNSLRFTVQSLPATGELWDPDDGILIEPEALPYNLPVRRDTLLYLPPLGYEGDVEFEFRAYDSTDLSSNPATIYIQTGGLLAVHNFTLDTDPGWSTEGLWEYGVPQGPQGQCNDPISGATGLNVYGYNLDGCYENNILSPYYLTTPQLDCSSLTGTQLQFQRWLGVEDADFDHAILQISDNGSDWSTLWEHTGGNINDNEWTLKTFDISTFADGRSSIQLRWGMGPSDEDVGYQGWNLDDIQILGSFSPSLGDIDGDGDADDADLRAFDACMAGPDATPAPPTPMTAMDCQVPFDFDFDGDVDLADFAEFMTSYTG